MTRPRCGNDPRAQLTDDDRQAVADFRAYLADRVALRDRIAAAIWERQNPGRRWADCEHPWGADAEEDATAVLAVLPPPADRAAVLRWAADALDSSERLRDLTDDHMLDINAAANELRRMADETPAAEAQAWQQEWDRRPNGADVSDLVDLQPVETYPPAAAGLPAGTLEAAEIGANRLDAWARTPQGRNFLAHALVQLARTGWLRTEPGEPFEPMREDAPSPEPVAETPATETQPETEEQRADREETERDHAAGNHQHCGVTCEVEFPTEMLRNTILYRAIPGSKTMLAELERRAATGAQPAEQVTVDTLARMLSDADVEINHGDYPTWTDLAESGQAQYRQAARYLLRRLHITTRAAVGEQQDGAQP